MDFKQKIGELAFSADTDNVMLSEQLMHATGEIIFKSYQIGDRIGYRTGYGDGYGYGNGFGGNGN